MPRNYNKQATQLLPAYVVYFLGLLVPGSGVELVSQSLPGLDVAAANPPTGVQRDPFIESFEQALDSARQWARFIGFLHALSRFLAVCNLTWATVVLLGAFVSNLIPSDFWFVLVLLLLEAAHLASASFFVCLLMRPLAYQSQAPQNIDHGEDGHYPRSRRARRFSYMVQCTLIIPRVVLSIIGFHWLLVHDLKTPNLLNSLYIFYISVFCNSLVAIYHLTLSAKAFKSLYKTSAPDQRPQQSILRYLDRILQNAQSSGLVQADDFDLFRFAYTMLGGEFSRNVQPEAVAKNHKELIKYLYLHRLGVDFLQIYMDERDAYVQLAAVNMVGFWADKAWGVGLESEVKLPKELLTKLADKVGTGQVGWAATTCIGVLANMPKWTDQLAQTRNSTKQPLLDCLADIIDVSSNRSLSIVRTLARLYEQLCRKEQGPPDPFTDADTNLVPKLRYLAERARVHRLRVQAAYLLSLMGKPCNGTIIAEIKPTQDDYWFQSEKEMLMLLRGESDTPMPTEQFPAIRDDKNIDPPSWARLGGSTA